MEVMLDCCSTVQPTLFNFQSEDATIAAWLVVLWPRYAELCSAGEVITSLQGWRPGWWQGSCCHAS